MGKRLRMLTLTSVVVTAAIPLNAETIEIIGIREVKSVCDSLSWHTQCGGMGDYPAGTGDQDLAEADAKVETATQKSAGEIGRIASNWTPFCRVPGQPEAAYISEQQATCENEVSEEIGPYNIGYVARIQIRKACQIQVAKVVSAGAQGGACRERS